MSKRFPTWIRRPWASDEAFQTTHALLDGLGLHTICQSARCPNISECWRQRTATFLILGEACTRNCRFCSVRHDAPGPVDLEEPARVAEAVRRLGLRHAVVTSVTRDDLEDGGAGAFVRTIEAVREVNPETTVEVLTPDFQAREADVRTVAEAGPAVFGHNVETVARLYPELRGAGHSYARALAVVRWIAELAAGSVAKSALMVGHGESEAEVRATLEDLRAAGCRAVCLGQYLQPGPAQRPVAEFVPPEQFEAYAAYAESLGFEFVASAPFVRSSYRAEAVLTAVAAKDETSCSTK